MKMSVSRPRRMMNAAALWSCTALSVCTLASSLWATDAHALDTDGDGVVDNADAFPCDPAFSGVTFVPSETGYSLFMFEDQWPESSDTDFNDVVAAVNQQFFQTGGGVKKIVMNLDVLAVGGKFDNGIAVHLPLPANTPATITRNVDGVTQTLQVQPFENEFVVHVFDNVREAFVEPGQPFVAEEIINADAAKPTKAGYVAEVTITFNTPQTLSTGAAPYDVYVFRSNNRKHQIHQPQFAGTSLMDQTMFNTGIDGSTSSRKFVTASGLPFALQVPTSSLHPLEGRSIATLFPDITTFASSGGTQQTDFFNRPVVANAFQKGSNNVTRPNPTTLLPVSVVTSCLNVRSGIAVVSGTGTGSKGGGLSLPLVQQSGFSVDVYGTASGAQAINNLFANINNYDVILIPDFAVADTAAIVTAFNANKTVLTNWVKAGGWLFMGTYDDGGNLEENLVNMPGLSVGGSDNRSTYTVVNSSPILTTPHNITASMQVNFGWEQFVSFPTGSTNNRIILQASSGYLTEFDLQSGHVIILGAPIITRYGGDWPGIEERSPGVGAKFYTNLLTYMTGG